MRIMQSGRLRQDHVDFCDQLVPDVVDFTIRDLQDGLEARNEVEDPSDFTPVCSLARDCDSSR